MILVLIGPKGSGKSHIGRLLDSHTNIFFLHVEPIWMEYYRECGMRGSEPSQKEALVRIRHAIDFALTKHEHIVLETTGASRELREFVAVLSEDYDTKRIRIMAPYDVCLNRIRSRSSENQIPMSEDMIRKVYDLSANPEPEDDMMLENVGLSDDMIAQRIGNMLRTA